MVGPEETIVKDIFSNKRTFLPGIRCSKEDVQKNFVLPILVDGLDREEECLILSILPKGADRIYLAELDKGLSGSKVYAVRYDVNGRGRGKTFVIKVGPYEVLDREAKAIENWVEPHIHGVGHPVYRTCTDKSIVVQELAGLGVSSSLKSLREYIREYEKADQLILRLFKDRLGHWYLPEKRRGNKQHQLKEVQIGEVFSWNLKKIQGYDVFPSEWCDLKTWVKKISGVAWGDLASMIAGLKSYKFLSPCTIVHGDLHSQNILIDERQECWPIDFAWCRGYTSPVIDFVMLECSLKFMSIPRRSDLRCLLKFENSLCREAFPSISVGQVPYSQEIRNVLNAILAVRGFAIQEMKITYGDYRKALCMMTYTLSNHPELNRPYVLGSLQILAGIEKKGD